MMFAKLQAYLESVRSSKNDPQKLYGDFVFLGGSASLLIPACDVAFYQGQEGKQIDLAVSIRPRSVVLYDRPVTLFELVSLIPRNSGK